MREGRKDKEKPGSGDLDSWMERPHHLRSSVGLLPIAEQSCSYCIELTKEAGLAILGRSSLQAINVQGEKAMEKIFCTHYQHLYMDQRKAFPSSEPHHGSGEICHFPVGLRLLALIWPTREQSTLT